MGRSTSAVGPIYCQGKEMQAPSVHMLCQCMVSLYTDPWHEDYMVCGLHHHAAAACAPRVLGHFVAW